MLRALGRDLWVSEQPLQVFGAAVGARMTVIRLEGGGIWLHSPVRPTPALSEALAALGPVVALVAPNRQHTRFLDLAAAAWPDAVIFLTPGLAADGRGGEALGERCPELWRHQIDQVRFGGVPALDEVAFYHRESRSLILTDLLFNFTAPRGVWTRLLLWAQGVTPGLCASPALRRGLVDIEAGRRAADRLLRWDFDRIVLAHGEVLEADARMRLAEALSWI